MIRSSRSAKGADTKPSLQSAKQQCPAERARATKSYRDAARSHIWVGLGDCPFVRDNLAGIWIIVKARLSEMVLEHILDDKRG